MSAYENQTVFASQEPVFQQPEQLPVDPQEQEKMQQAQRKRKKLFLALGGLLFLLLVLLIVAGSMRRRQMSGTQTPTPTPETQESTTLTPLQQAIQNSQSVIKNADPTVNEYPFPPINFGMTLQPPKR